MTGFLKLYRKLEHWQWYKDSNTKSLFIHCILKAAYEDKSWQGTTLKPGQFITGRITLSQELGLSEKQVRTALEKLKRTNEITVEGSNRFSLVTVNNWDSYQFVEEKGPANGPSEGPAEWPTNCMSDDQQMGQQVGQQKTAVNRAASKDQGQQMGQQIANDQASKILTQGASQGASQGATTKKLRNQENSPPIVPPRNFSDKTISNLTSCGFSEKMIIELESRFDEKSVCETLDWLREKDISKIDNLPAYLHTVLEKNAVSNDKKMREFLGKKSAKDPGEALKKGVSINPEDREFFEKLQDSLKCTLGEPCFKSWFYELDLIAKDENKLVLGAPKKFVVDHINNSHEIDLEALSEALNVGQVQVVHKAIKIA